MSQEPAFKVTLECKNCGNKWDREVEAGIQVQGLAGGVEIGHNNYQTCPVCELLFDVTVADREPLDGS